ncbi:MAG: glycogen synthase [Woeseiaceae bacterium]|nr:glycogen synthase [Woeseiaceae bacterium]
MGDVVRDLPRALADAGCTTTVITPAYGALSKLGGARQVSTLELPFGEDILEVEVIEVPGFDSRVRNVVLEHPLFSPRGAGRIYLDDGSGRPFASDAGKFALLSAAAAAYIAGLEQPPQVVHLHDWHAALYCLLRASAARYAGLRDIRTVYTIHNLAFQGIRPLRGDASSLECWFPDLRYDAAVVADPRYPDCVNPMAVGIRLADKVNTVSPTYAREILLPSDPARGFSGGEGLEQDLRAASAQGRLTGILNGCDYPKRDRRRPGWRRLLETIGAELAQWRGKNAELDAIHALATERIKVLPRRRPANVLTSIGRLTVQKADLFLQPAGAAGTALEAILRNLDRNGVLIMVGSGDAQLQRRIADIAARHENFLFLCGYSESFAEMLYAAGDLFLMPSSFEPCGISQMLAMRSGQPCVVHEVGGLKDTVRDGITGFTFGGDNPVNQARHFVSAVDRALRMRASNQDRWLQIRHQAEAQRFSWHTAAQRYLQDLYEIPRP